jgi:hypothetical protein
MGWTTGVQFSAGTTMGFLLFATAPVRLSGPPRLLSHEYRMLLPKVVKRPGHEAYNSPPSSAEVKNAWSYTSTPQYDFMAWCLIKQDICMYGVLIS